MYKGFWENLKKPIIGFAPMDGVTDAACRYITDKYGKPSILFTEFTSAEGVTYGAEKLLDAFIYHRTSTPTVAQIFGNQPEAFYKMAIIIAEMGFDGIDINMGCPEKNVAKRGAGAGLILQPKLAQELIQITKQAAQEWAEGKKISDIDLKSDVLGYVKNFQQKFQITPVRRVLPVSVKTRIGVEEIVTEDWIKNLLEAEPVNITVHGRTLKQLYSGVANWEEIGKAAEVTKGSETTLLGNGDIKSMEDALEKIKTYKTDGALIGRSAWGNPWIFANTVAETSTRFQTALEHCEKFEEFLPNGHFLSLRKHLAWYCKGFEGATDFRVKLMQVKSAAEVKEIINKNEVNS